MDNILEEKLNVIISQMETELERTTQRVTVREGNQRLKEAGLRYLNLTWLTKDYREIKVRDMTRSHVRNCLQWCLKHQGGPDSSKNGIFYTDWISYFTVRLLDPELGE